MRKWIYLVGFLPTLLAVAQSYEGRVYHDKNGNGKWDDQDVPLSGVAVSNGLDVVKTNKVGEYSLREGRGDFIFITMPAGYKAEKHFTRTSSENFDFGLLPHEPSASSDFSLIHLTDTETDRDNGWVDPIRQYAHNNQVAFIVHTGDIHGSHGLDFHGARVNSQTMNVPTFYCLGNHDLVPGETGEKYFEDNFGPIYYSFEAGNYHFVITPMLHGDAKPGFSKTDVYNWLKNDLKEMDPKKQVVIFNHDLLSFSDEFVYEGGGKKKLNLTDYNLKAWGYGHWHINYLKSHGDSGVVSVSSSSSDKGGIDHSASNFLVYSIDRDDDLSISPVYNFVESHQVANLIQDGDKVKVSVNAYHTPAQTVAVTASTNQDFNTGIALSQNNDWNWSGDVGASEKIWVRSEYADGSSITKVYSISESNQYLDLKWSVNTGGHTWMTSPVVVGDALIVSAIDEFNKEKNFIMAYSREDGTLTWKSKIGNAVKHRVSSYGGNVLVTDIDGVAYSLDGQTGEILWSKALGQTYLPSYVGSGRVDEGVYYTGNREFLSALDAQTGEVIWKNKDWKGGEGTTTQLTVTEDLVVAHSNWRALYVHDKNSGQLKWQLEENGIRFRSASAAYVADTLFVLGHNTINLVSDEGVIARSNELPFGLQVATTPLVTEELIIFGTSQDGMVALDRSSLKTKWNIKVGEAIFYTSPYSSFPSATVETGAVQYGDWILFGSSDGVLYMAELETGRVVERFNIGAPILSDVTILDDWLYVSDFAGSVYAFRIKH